MKSIHFKVTFPLSLLLFDFITKWWYVEQVDGPNRYFYGFPLMYKTNSLATSMCTEYFLLPMVIDFVVYFSVIFLLVVLVQRKIKLVVGSVIVVSTYVVAALYLMFNLLVSDSIYKPVFTDNGFAITVEKTGICIVGENP